MLTQGQFEWALPEPPRPAEPPCHDSPLANELARFNEFGKVTRQLPVAVPSFTSELISITAYLNEYWTSAQRQANRLHEISYRACFKPQLPRFFIERLTRPKDIVYDPFMGRGTTPVEAAVLGRIPYGCDVNPLSAVLTRPRLNPPDLADIAARLETIDFTRAGDAPEDLLAFYHPETLQAISALREYLLRRPPGGGGDAVDDWIRMVAVNRLTGHSPGFFSVYTLPPNQAVSVQSQRRINERRAQTPPRRDVRRIILRKSRMLLSQASPELRRRLVAVAPQARLLTSTADRTPDIPDQTVDLVVTSPPFLDVVDYATDNWLRCWFLAIDPASVQLTVVQSVELWQNAMTKVFLELHRVLKPGGHVAFEVGELHGGTVRLEEAVLPCAQVSGLEPTLVMINDQMFTKTANCWGVANNAKGTNTNRIIVLRKP